MYSRLWVFMGKLWVIYLDIQNGSVFRGVFVFFGEGLNVNTISTLKKPCVLAVKFKQVIIIQYDFGALLG